MTISPDTRLFILIAVLWVIVFVFDLAPKHRTC